MHNRFRIGGVDKLTFGVTAFDDAIRFATDWGLAPVSTPLPDRRLFRARDGSEIEILHADAGDPARSPIGNPSGLCELTWGVLDAAALDELAEELGRDRAVQRDADGSVHSVDDLGIRIAFRLTRRAGPAAEPTRYNSPGHAERIDRRGARYQQASPHEISHVAIGVDDAAEAARFYTERLGFLVSDRYANRGLFLRCSPSGNHHHLFLMNGRAPGTRLNHLAFKVRDVHEVIGGGQYIDARGWETFAGPGRHAVSSACFWYFNTPLGCAFEYAADEDIVTEGWEATDFAATAHIFSEWTFGLEKSDGRLRGPISHSRDIASGTVE